jgi:hypothetical protein
MAVGAALLALLTTVPPLGAMPLAAMRVRALPLAAMRVRAVPPGALHGSQAGPLAALTQTSFVKEWQQGPFTQDQGAPIAESSPIVATLDGQGPSVVVGDRSGYLYAFHISNGSAVTGWPVNDGGPPIDSTPSVAALEGSVMAGGSALDSVFVGAGNAEYPDKGGYMGFGPNGSPLWDTKIVDPGTDAHPAYGVQASLTVADLQGGAPDVFAGSLDQESYALDAANGSALSGWPFFSADSVFSTAAAADLYGTSQTELVVGGASTKGFALGQIYAAGGHLRILDSRGGLICSHAVDQEVDSSPAVGGFLRGGAVGIVVGTGSYYPGTSDTNVLDAFNSTCGLVWSGTLDGFTGSSPALADVQDNGTLDVVEGTDNGITGDVWVLDGATGAVIWHSFVDGRVLGSVVTADLTGDGYQDILVPTTQGVEVLDGMNGIEVGLLGKGLGFQNSPLVTDDPNGTIGITVAGYNGNNEGVVQHYEIPGSNGGEAVGAGSWPMFHHDPQLTGTTSGLPTPGTVSPCSVPAEANAGYDLVAADGGVFTFGQPFCGSAEASKLAPPVVGIAMSPGTGGYWVADAEGGVLNFGGAQLYGSMTGKHINSPMVGIAARPNGLGYWLVSADGGVFAFGAPATYFGSLVSRHLTAPIVGIASTPDGNGYWLVASNGEVFAFGDANLPRSTLPKHLNAPIVSLTPDVATGGYWLTGADGGVFNFNAPFEGSMGSTKLNEHIVGMASTADGGGYWLVAADGGVFAFGDAPFVGSMASRRLNNRVVSVSGYCG